MDVRPVDEWSKPLPALEPVSTEFWAAAAEGRLLIQRCPACGHRQFYPRGMCTACGENPEWEEASGGGTVHTFTIIRQQGARGFRDDVPYAVAIIELDEGPRMMGNITGASVDQVAIGMRVRAYAVAAAEGIGIPMWEPA
jgi:uncharacterized OB-fold protein